MLRHMMDGTTASFTVQDELVWEDSRHFLPQGRRDEVVQVGGRNVSPAHVAQVLRRHPRVRDASVRLMRPDEGLRLKAFVVPRQHNGKPADWIIEG